MFNKVIRSRLMAPVTTDGHDPAVRKDSSFLKQFRGAGISFGSWNFIYCWFQTSNIQA